MARPRRKGWGLARRSRVFKRKSGRPKKPAPVTIRKVEPRG